MRKLPTIAFFSVICVLFLAVLAQDALAQLPTQIPQNLTISQVLERVADYMFWLLLLVSVVFFIIAAYEFVTSMGDPERVKKARNMILYGLIGLIVAFSARALVYLIASALGVGPQAPGQGR